MSYSRASRSRQGSQQRSAAQHSQHQQAGLGGGDVGLEDVGAGVWGSSGAADAAVPVEDEQERKGAAGAYTIEVDAEHSRSTSSSSSSSSRSSHSATRRAQRLGPAAVTASVAPSSASSSASPAEGEVGQRTAAAASHLASSQHSTAAAQGSLLVPAAAAHERGRGGGGGGRRPSHPAGLDPSASVALLEDDDGADGSRSLLSPSSSVRAEGRLNALLYPESAYSSSKMPIRSFYHSQNEFIEELKKLVLLQHSEEGLDEAAPSTAAYLAIQISLALTFVLLGLKLFTAIYSGSIAVVASAVDSGLDVLSQGTLLLISRAMKKYDPYTYPAGKNRMEPVAVLLFSVIMGMAALFLLYESVSDLQEGLADGGKKVHMDAVTVTILCVVVGVQLLMWLYCRRIAALRIPGASAADALAQDHINDVFINIIGGGPAILAGYLPSAWLADPIGGICLSIYIAIRWTLTAWEQVPAMTGRTADPSFLNQLTYLAGTHDPRILKVDTILAYHVGLKYQCEVHIVLHEDMLLREAHDIGESLEQKIERLDSVEMAFVHLDYEYDHKPEHVHTQHTTARHTARLAVPPSDAQCLAAAQPHACSSLPSSRSPLCAALLCLCLCRPRVRRLLARTSAGAVRQLTVTLLQASQTPPHPQPPPSPPPPPPPPHRIRAPPFCTLKA